MSRLLALAFLLSLAGTAAAQPARILRGSVRDSASRAPIAGAVLVLLDASGTSLGRNITNERGEYSIALHSAMRRIQVLRLGFRPQTLRIPDAVDGIARLDVVMPAIPRLLESVTVMDQPNCPRRDDRAAAFSLWEQARAALLAIVVARETNPPHVMRLHSIRRLDAGERMLSQRIRIDSASTSRPFVATRTAAEFVERGFSYDSIGMRWHNGPDAETMLDDAFVRGYCFHLASADTARPTQIGLGFAPAKRKGGRVDIEGTVWIDSTTRSLADIVFKYVGEVSMVEKMNPGGRISFRTMENGTALIDRWVLRSGGFERPPSGARLNARQLLNAPLVATETGGEVATARWPDGLHWRGSLGTVRGQLADSQRAGIQIQLIDTDYSATTDSLGRFEISYLLPGPYRIGVVDPLFSELDIMMFSDNRFIAVRDSVVTVVVNAPTPLDYVAGLCKDIDLVHTGALVARVELPDGRPAEGANVEVRVFADRRSQRLAHGKTDANGLFQLCGAPRRVQLTLRVDHDDAQPGLFTTEITTAIQPLKARLKAKR